MNRRLLIIVSGLLCLMLVALTGCTVAGFSKIDDALNNVVNVKSYEGNGSISLEFSKTDAAKPMKLGDVELSSLGKLDLLITSIKQSEPNLLSVTGKVSMMNKLIPFTLQLNKAQLSILIDNNPKPIVFKLDALIGESIKVSGIDISTIFADPNKLLSLVSPFVISKLPNLKNISVSAVNEKINGESVDLQKIHTELNSTEAIEFTKSLLKNIADHPEDVKTLVTQLYKAFFVTGEVKAGEIDFSGIIIDVATKMLVEQLQMLTTSLDSTTSKDGDLASYLNDKTSLKTDLYLDSAIQLRKFGLDLNLGGAIKATGSMSFWKVNQAVTADPAMNIPSDAFQWKGSSIMAHYLKSLDKTSDTYQLLFNDLHVLSKEIKLVIPPYDQSGKVAEGKAYISKTNRTMVPVRYISETLDSDVKWDDVKKQVTIIDILSGRTIVLTLNSTIATIDGKETSLDSPATLTNGSTYVQVGFIVDALGAKKTWDNDTRTVTISKK